MGRVSKTAVKEFLSRDLETWDWVKEVPEKELDETLDSFAPNFQFKTVPYKHQKAAFLLALIRDSFLYLLDMGGGKTKIVLDAINYRKQHDKVKRTLILVPNTVTIASWEEEIRTHSDFTSTPLIGTAKERWELLENTNTDLYVLNYAGLQSMITVIVKLPGKKNGKRCPDEARVKKFIDMFDAVTFDEIHLCKNTKSLTFRLCNRVSAATRFRYGLTGTPFGRDPSDLWAQCYLIDRGATLGSTLGIFRSTFFTAKNNFWGGIDYTIRRERQRQLSKMLKNTSIRYAEEEMNDLPPKIYDTVSLPMPKENRDYYNNVLKGFMNAQGDLTQLKGAFSKLRQCASGFLKFRDNDGVEQVIKFKQNPKLEALIDLIQATPPSAKIIVFNEFILSGDYISERFDSLKIKYARLYSGTLDKIAAKDTFVKNPDCKVFLVNSQSGSVALNLQVAQYAIFYESPVSPIVRKQAEKRCHRTGQKKRVFYYDLIARKSVDDKVREYLQEGKDLFMELIEKREELVQIT